jgi:hypothetical protein
MVSVVSFVFYILSKPWFPEKIFEHKFNNWLQTHRKTCLKTWNSHLIFALRLSSLYPWTEDGLWDVEKHWSADGKDIFGMLIASFAFDKEIGWTNIPSSDRQRPKISETMSYIAKARTLAQNSSSAVRSNQGTPITLWSAVLSSIGAIPWTILIMDGSRMKY